MTTLLLLGGSVVLLVAIVYVAKRWGHAAADADFYEQSNKHSVKAREIDDKVARLADTDLDDELRGDK